MSEITAATWPTISAQLAAVIEHIDTLDLEVFTVRMATIGSARRDIVVLKKDRDTTRAGIAATGIEWTVSALHSPYLHLTAPTPGGVFTLTLLTDDPDIKAGLGLTAGVIGSVLDVSA